MVGMQMPESIRESIAQLSQYSPGRRNIEPVLSTQPHDVRFPAAIDASPAIAREAAHSQPAVILVVAALHRSAAARVALVLSNPSMSGTWAARG
jgi:hypothetical protein